MAKNKRCNSKSFRIDNQVYFVVGKYLETQGSTVSTEIKKTLYKFYNDLSEELRDQLIKEYEKENEKYWNGKNDVN